MNYCERCGVKYDESSEVCPACGKPYDVVKLQRTFRQQPRSGPTQLQISYEQNGQYNYSLTPPIVAIKERISSKLFYALVIVVTVLIMPAVLAGLAFLGYLLFDDSSEYTLMVLGIEPALVAVGLILFFASILPYAMSCMGMWRLYLSERRGTETGVSMPALGLIRRAQVLLIYFTVAQAGLTFLTSVAAQNTAALLPQIIAAALSIVYLKKLIGVIDSVLHTVSTSQPSPNISSFVVVMNYICAGFLSIAAIILFMTYVESSEILLLLLSLYLPLFASSNVMLALILSSYKKCMYVYTMLNAKGMTAD